MIAKYPTSAIEITENFEDYEIDGKQLLHFAPRAVIRDALVALTEKGVLGPKVTLSYEAGIPINAKVEAHLVEYFESPEFKQSLEKVLAHKGFDRSKLLKKIARNNAETRSKADFERARKKRKSDWDF